MRVTVGKIKLASSTALALLGLGDLYVHIAQRGDPALALAACAWSVDLAVSCLATTLSFAAFPRTRRSDLARTTLLVLVLIQIADRAVFGELRLASLAADAAGAYGVFAASCLERLRTLVRDDPSAPFSIVYPEDRRRRRRSMKAAAPTVLG